VEGGSTDNTFQVAVELMEKNPEKIIVLKQFGEGKFNAVIQGARECRNELILIWDADGTVPLSCTRKIISTALETNSSVMGNRLKGNMEKNAMRLANYLGNWFFAILWAPILSGQINDLLCGTKIFPISVFQNVSQRIMKLDPYGDFALLLTARLQGSSVVSVPVNYGARKYGKTNIKRWRGGFQLLTFTFVAYFIYFLKRLKNHA
jgi:glycosyltransferase involved in cell wall biosynthesis